ncbi:MAG TPA: AAA family ATPase [Hyphomicrobiales bacterium]|nr:AAA family ATPase [Hyphomicrobiales bacterium]
MAMTTSRRGAAKGDKAGDNPLRLAPGQLLRRCDLSKLAFRTTAELADGDLIAGQQRAIEALRFAAAIERPGFNLFVIGPPGTGKRSLVRDYLKARAKALPAPSDWVYVNNFADAYKPKAVQLPAGQATAFRDAMAELIEDLGTILPAAFESENYQNRHGAIDEQFRHRQEEGFEALKSEAEKNHIAIMRTPMGFAMAPATEDGDVMKPDAFNALPEEKRKATEEVIGQLQDRLGTILKSIPKWDKERRQAVRELNRETAKAAVAQPLDELKSRFAGVAPIQEHLQVVQKDLIDNAGLFIAERREDDSGIVAISSSDTRFDRYQVNVLVSHEDGGGAPVIEETHPSLGNLVGRIEHIAQQGTLTTNFRLIKGGALHRANGGFLLVDIRQILLEPLSWIALKRALRNACITIESVSDYLGAMSTISLEPDPVPLKVKVALLADRMTYYLLSEYDPDMRELFKVVADFDDSQPWSQDAAPGYAHMIAVLARRESLRPLTRDAVARVIEQAGKQVEDSQRLSLVLEPVADLLREADFLAGEAGRKAIGADDVAAAVLARRRRAGRLEERAREHITRGIALVDTAGEAVGQVNGLSVLSLAGFSFGRPSRITARVRLGAGKVVDIEREVDLGGPIHSKGVLILSGYLAANYAPDTPMSLSASLVFEQSYGGVDGDSASAAELFALLSALAEVPLRQDLAITGSINQMGQIQAIGGVNEKIEGFFDLCAERGLTASQGVIIPAANVQHLMLREDVVEACAAGKFSVYAIETAEQGIELLTGKTAGRRGPDGAYEAGSVNSKVEERLVGFAMARKRFGAGKDGGTAQ